MMFKGRHFDRSVILLCVRTTANRWLMKICDDEPCQKLPMIHSIVATVFQPRSSPRAVCLYFRVPLSLCMVEDMLAVRDTIITHQTRRASSPS